MITKSKSITYYAPTRKRRYFSLNAACNGEAGAIIKNRYPTEEFNREDGYSFYWHELKRSNVMYRRLSSLIKSKFKVALISTLNT
jgi:hypothetical protein